MKPQVAILGCGPAGMMAAHAVALSGKPFAIFSKPVKSRLGGAQFLHEAIPLLHKSDEPEVEITYRFEGDAQTYQQKVYGVRPVPFVSAEFIKDGDVQPAWNLIKAYEELWKLYSSAINEAVVDSVWLESMRNEFDLIISSIPLQAICSLQAGHKFLTQTVMIHPTNIMHLPDNTIVYDGTRDRSWYRQSFLFGVGGTEYPNGTRPPVKPLINAVKPISNTCDCFPDVLKVGRYGRWKKGVLAHDGFFTTANLLDVIV